MSGFFPLRHVSTIPFYPTPLSALPKEDYPVSFPGQVQIFPLQFNVPLHWSYIFLLFLIQTLTQKLSLLELVPPSSGIPSTCIEFCKNITLHQKYCLYGCILYLGAFQVALVVKNLPANAGDMRCGFNPWIETILWRRVWQSNPTNPTPVFLPGEVHGQRSLVGYSP